MTLLLEATDAAVLAGLGSRLAGDRIRRELSQAQLAAAAGVGKRTLERMEAGDPTSTRNLVRVLRALHALDQLEAVLPEPPPSPVAALDRQKTARRRARPGGPRQEPGASWAWGEQT